MTFPGESRRFQSRVIVCERRQRWAIALRRALASDTEPRIRVLETRSWAACRAELATTPYGIAVVEWLADSADEHLEWLWNSCRSSSLPRILVAGVPHADPRRWAILETGVLHVLHSVRDVLQRSRWIRGQALNAPTRQFSTIQEEVLAGLPWAGYASHGNNEGEAR